MTAHPDILERKDGLRTSFAGSLLFHVSIFGGLMLMGWLQSTNTVRWGDQNALEGGSVTVTPVGIPLPRTSMAENHLASDTKSNVPVEPAEEKPVKKQRAAVDDDEGIPLKSKKQKKRPKDKVKERTTDYVTERAQETRRYVPKQEYKPNQVYSTTPQAISSNLYSGTPGTAIGIGNNNAFGNRFGAYADAMRRRISEKWRTSEIDPRIKNAPAAVVTFELFRDGTIRNVQLKERSGVLSLDYSVQRAVQEAAPFQPIPRDYERESAVIELSFHLKR